MYPIPANATRIRYLESTGTQYVDTGIVPTPTLSLDCSGYFPNAAPGARFGSRVSATSKCFYVSGVTSDGADKMRFALGSSGTGVSLQRYADSKPLRRFVLDAASKSASLEYADGTTGALSFSQSAFTGSYPIYLLAFNNAGTASFSITGTRLSACRIIDGSTLVRSFVPVRVGSTGYLFDRVSGQIFGNAGTGDFILGPDTFQQGVVPTRMMVAGVKRKARPPTVFNYIGVKIAACRKMRNCASLSAYRSAGSNMMQMSEFQILDASNSRYSLPSDATISAYTAYNGERHYSDPKLVSNYNSGEGVGRLFDGSTSTKWALYGYFGPFPIYDFDTGTALMVAGGSYDATFRETHFGIGNDSPYPVSLVIDVSSNPLDLSTYTQWQLLNANDNASATNRTVVEMEVLGSADGMTWWRLGISNNPNAINTNYAVVHSGNLVPRAGDIWSDLDMATRDWANGITVDNI